MAKIALAVSGGLGACCAVVGACCVALSLCC